MITVSLLICCKCGHKTRKFTCPKCGHRLCSACRKEEPKPKGKAVAA